MKIDHVALNNNELNQIYLNAKINNNKNDNCRVFLLLLCGEYLSKHLNLLLLSSFLLLPRLVNQMIVYESISKPYIKSNLIFIFMISWEIHQ